MCNRLVELISKLNEVHNKGSELARRQIDKAAKLSINRFGEAVRPIYGSTDDGEPTHIGSCTLLRIDGTPLLVTAAHVIDDNRVSTLYLATDSLDPIEAECFLTAPPGGDRSKDHYDFAMVELKTEMVDKLGKDAFIDEVSFVSGRDNQEGHFYTALGYPHSQNKKFDRRRLHVKGKLRSYSGISNPRKDLIANKNLSECEHIFISMGKRSNNVTGEMVTTFWPEGMSGGPIFDVSSIAKSILSLDEREPKLAGIVVEFHRDYETLLATRIEVVVDIFRDIKGLLR